MTDQLTMRLEPPLPKLPSGLRPMLARPIPEPFDSSAHLFEPMWGGARALALIGPAETAGAGEVSLIAEDGTAGPAPVDLTGLAMRIDARSAVIDGEIVVVDDAGMLDRKELNRRLLGGSGRPLSFLAFDLLDLDGRSLLNLSLDKRRQLLRQVLRPGDEAVSEATVKLRAEGVRYVVTGEGNGPVNALDFALREAIGQAFPEVAKFELIDYKVRISDQGHGTDAITRVLIETSDGVSSWVTVGVGHNVIEASWGALVDGLTFGLRRHGA